MRKSNPQKHFVEKYWRGRILRGRRDTIGHKPVEPNFIDVVRSRKQADLHAPIDEGAISTTLVHLANISYRLGRTLHFDAASYSCVGDPEANKMFTRNYRKPFVVPEKV